MTRFVVPFREYLPDWLIYIDIGFTLIASALWYLKPSLGILPLFFILFVWVLRFALIKKIWLSQSYEISLFLFIVTAGMSVWAAFDKGVAWQKFWLILAAVFVFYSFARATEKSVRIGQLWILVTVAAGISVYFLTTHPWHIYPAKISLLTSIGISIQRFLPNVSTHTLHPNVVGGLLAMFFPFTLPLFLHYQHQKRYQIILGMVAMLIGFSLIMTTSRAAWLALAIAMGLMGFYQLVTSQKKFWLILAGILSLVLVWVLADHLLNIFFNLFASESNGQSRLQLYQTSLTLVWDYPFIGAGLNNYMMLYSTYAFLIHVGFNVHAHNLFLDLAIEQGLVTLFIFFVMVGILTVSLWKQMSKGQLQTWSIAGILSLITILVHGIFDDALYGSRGILFLFIPFAFVPAKPLPLSKKFLLSIAIPLILLFSLNSKKLLSQFYANLGAVYQSRTELSVYEWPQWVLQDDVRRQIPLDTPINYYQQALTFNSNNFTANRRLGQIDLALANYESALTHLQIAYDEKPYDNATQQLLGEAYIVNGNLVEGENLWQNVNQVQKQLDAREFWYQYIHDDERFDAIKQVKEQVQSSQ